MLNELVAVAEAQAKAAARRIAVPAAFAVVGGLFVLFAVAGLFAALFFWIEPDHGPIIAALICAAVALVLAILALLPLAFRRPAPPPPRPNNALPQFVSLLARTAPGLSLRQIAWAAVLIGAAVLFGARANRK
jgi:hypothetical protein